MDMMAGAIASPTERDFSLFQRLIQEESGIYLAPAKKELLVARLRRRLRELGHRSFKEYYAQVVDDAGERTRLLDCISTNETRFFREPQQLSFLSQRVLPRLRRLAAAGARPPRLRAWSAGCATGEEAYTLAMIFRRELPPEDGWDLEILGSDLSTQALERAAEACYPIERAKEIPEPYLRTFMLRGIREREGWMTVGPAARSIVRLARINLHADAYPPAAFDLVLCRNVLIYFDGATRERVVGRLAECLAPAGLLLLGHAESLTGQQHGLRYAGPLTYGRPMEGTWW